MATILVGDVVEPTEFAEYIVERTAELSALFSSRILVPSQDMNEKVRTGGRLLEMPFWNDVASDDPNIATGTSDATPKDIGTGQDTSRVADLNQAWAADDLAADVAGSDGLRVIGDRIASYWDRALQKRLIYSLTGVQVDNAAADSGDMIHNIYQDVASPTTGLIDADAILQTKQTMGDAASKLVAIAMHSATHTRLQSLNLIDTIPDARGETQISFYQGYRVIVDDGMVVVSGSNADSYTTVLFGEGAFAWGESAPKTAPGFESDRNILYGAGGGQETIISRRRLIMHPRGIRWLDASVAADGGPDQSELEDAANWARVWERKNIRMAFLVHNV